jgi:hypothetical protein
MKKPTIVEKKLVLVRARIRHLTTEQLDQVGGAGCIIMTSSCSLNRSQDLR